MKLGEVVKNLKSALLFVFFFIFFVGAFLKIKTLFHSPKKFVVHFDRTHGFSKKMLTHLNLFAKEQEKLSPSPQLLNVITQETFPSIDTFAVRSYLTGLTQIILTSAKPIALINKKYVLLSNNNLVAYDIFSENNLSHLPSFAVEQSLKDKETYNISDRCKKFVRTFDQSLLKNYEVQWIHETEIILHDKKYPQISMVIDDTIAVTPALQLAYQEVRTQKLEKETKSKGRDWFIDVRFRKQIIVFPGGQRV